jgi:endonuclease/exonuclease/phosphatase family metal-dependent hydrolase
MSRRKWMSIAGIIGLGSATALVGARSLWWIPPQKLEVEIHCDTAPSIPRGKPIKVLIWNIQYAGSRNYHFFYDGGEDVSVSEAHVYESLDAIADVIRAHDPDILLLQEVDRGSRRTRFIDEHEELLRRLRYPCHTSAAYHKVAYVPHPSHEPLGKVDMHLSVFSKYAIDGATRYQLPLLNESKVRQLFNLRRALLEIRFPTESGADFIAFNTHLSAFSKGDGTLDRQLKVLDEHMNVADAAGSPWILAGDLNALPPGDSRDRLGDDAIWYAELSPIQRLFDRYTHPVSSRLYSDEPEPWRTYLPPSSDRPDRTLDYLFHGDQVQTLSYSVIQNKKASTTSDHLPILAEVRID